jgi:hypothetical protein
MSGREFSDAHPAVGDPGLLSLALGLVLGPTVALVHQLIVYAIGSWACGHDVRAVMHVVPVLSLIVVFAAALIARRHWRATGNGEDDETSDLPARTRFLALLGITISLFSAIVIAAQWVSIFVFDPCMRG